MVAVAATWAIGGILGSSCDTETSQAGFSLIGVAGLVSATWIARTWLRGGVGSRWRFLYVVPLSLLAAAVPTGLAAFVAMIAWFENCFTLGF